MQRIQPIQPQPDQPVQSVRPMQPVNPAQPVQERNNPGEARKQIRILNESLQQDEMNP
jgi:hypothetical protein